MSFNSYLFILIATSIIILLLLCWINMFEWKRCQKKGTTVSGCLQSSVMLVAVFSASDVVKTDGIMNSEKYHQIWPTM